MRLDIHKDYEDVRLPRAKLERLFERIVDGEIQSPGDSTVNLVFTTDERLQELNQHHRRKNEPTDVLSFNIDDPDTTGGTFGEIYISVDTANRQASEYGLSETEEYLRLTCHGLLHLCGYDHMKRDDEAEMKAREERYLSSLESD